MAKKIDVFAFALETWTTDETVELAKMCFNELDDAKQYELILDIAVQNLDRDELIAQLEEM